MDQQKLRQVAHALLREQDALFTLPDPDPDELLTAMTAAAEEGKASRPQTIFDTLATLFSAGPARYAAPAFCALLLAVGLWALLHQPALPYQRYSAAGLPVTGIVRGDETLWTAGGWSPEAKLDGYTLEDSFIASAAAAADPQPVLQMVCLYSRDEKTARITVSQTETPLWLVLSAGESKTIHGTPVFFGHDESASLRAAVWQSDGLTLSIEAGGLSGKELLELVKVVLKYDETNR